MDLLAQTQREVEQLVRATGTIDRAEELINTQVGLDTDQRAALWLLAWSLLPKSKQYHEARAHLRLVSLISG